MHRNLKSRNIGFTLIEMVIVIVVIGVLSTMTTDIITMPVKSYMDLSRRTSLANNAEMALTRMQRDIRQALPNSIRITGSGTVIEMLRTTDGGRYRKSLTFAGTGDILDFSTTDSSMDIIGALQSTPSGSLVINNTGVIGGNDAYAGDNLSAITSATTTQINFSAKQFPSESQNQLFFVVDKPVTYLCDTGNNQLLRYEDYSIAATQSNPPSGASYIQVNDVSACLFAYSSGGSSRSGLVTLTITLTDSAGESVRLFHQVHVNNTP